MWIRSQDKRRIIKCEEITIDYLNGQFNDEQLKMLNTQKGWGLKNKYHVLGFYSTKEKALKVLDMIQDAIGGVPETDIKGNVIGIAVKKIFQMPQDDEV